MTVRSWQQFAALWPRVVSGINVVIGLTAARRRSSSPSPRRDDASSDLSPGAVVTPLELELTPDFDVPWRARGKPTTYGPPSAQVSMSRRKRSCSGPVQETPLWPKAGAGAGGVDELAVAYGTIPRASARGGRAHWEARPASAVDKQTVNGSEERHRAARHARELQQPMGQRFAAASALELLAGDRAPQRVDDSGRLAGDLLD